MIVDLPIKNCGSFPLKIHVETTNQKKKKHPKSPESFPILPIRTHLGSRGRIWCWAEPSAGHCSWWPRKLPIWIKCAGNIGWKYRVGGCRWGGAFHSVHFFVHNELALHHPSSCASSFSYLLSPMRDSARCLTSCNDDHTYHHHLQGNSTWFPKNIFHDLTHVDLTHQGEHFRDPAQARPSMAISIKDQTRQRPAKPCSRMKTLLMLSFWICCHMCISNISISFNFTIEICSSPHSPSCSRPVPRSWHPTLHLWSWRLVGIRSESSSLNRRQPPVRSFLDELKHQMSVRKCPSRLLHIHLPRHWWLVVSKVKKK